MEYEYTMVGYKPQGHVIPKEHIIEPVQSTDQAREIAAAHGVDRFFLIPERHGNELWEFDENGLMRRRDASINDYEIEESERRYRWERPEEST